MKLRTLLCLTLGLALPALPAFGWGAAGHKMLTRTALKALPQSVPGFVRSPAAIAEMAYLAPEPDRQKGAGETRDKAMSPGHYLDAGDDGRIFGGPKLSSLPLTRADYDTALRKAGHTQYAAGYLPYSVIEGYQLLKRDFGAWRVVHAGVKRARSAAEKKRFLQAQKYREDIVIHDLGVWSHFVGDGSMPLHVTVHFNGWGHYPNPQHFTQAHVHVPWETAYVSAYVDEAMVQAHMPKRVAAGHGIFAETEGYLKATNAAVVPFYRLEKQHAFAQHKPTRAGIAFTAAQLGHGAGMLRDLILQAWQESDKLSFGWPAVAVSKIEAGKVRAFIP